MTTKPAFPELVNAVRALATQGRFGEALGLIERAVAQLPQDADKVRLLQLDIARAGGNESVALAALRALHRVVLAQPQVATKIVSSLRLRKEPQAAWSILQQLAPMPASAPEAFLVGVEYANRGKLDTAQAAYRYAIQCKPEFFEALVNLGDLLLRARDFLAARPLFEAALHIDPNSANAWLGLGQCQLNLGRNAEALAAFAHLPPPALASPLVTAWRASAISQTGDADTALSLYEQALAGDPHCFPALFGSALILEKHGSLEAAAKRYERACAADPKSNWALSNLVYCLRCMAAWPRMAGPEAELLRRLRSGDIEGYGSSSWVSLDLPGPVLREIAADYTRTQSRLRVGGPREREFARVPHPRIRVGYLSADFRDHATSRLFAEVLEYHDRERFEFFAYALQPSDDSPIAQRVVAACEHFIDVSGLPAEPVAQRILADLIDVLVDLNGHTQGECTGLVALRPAPILVSYLGYPGSMGDYVDYIIGDEFVTPRGAEAEFSEAIARLPGSYLPHDSKRDTGVPTTRAEHGLPDDAIVACSFNQAWKITPAVWTIWMDVLQAHPSAILWLLEENPWITQNLRLQAERAGVAPARLIFAPRMPQLQHLARIALADIAFDTLPCNSHTTGSDALWMGVPLVTVTGDAFKGRVGASLLHAVGLPELIAHDLQEYASKLKDLIGSPGHLAALKALLLERRHSAALYDSRTKAATLERAYARMYERYLAGEAPSQIVLGDVSGA